MLPLYFVVEDTSLPSENVMGSPLTAHSLEECAQLCEQHRGSGWQECNAFTWDSQRKRCHLKNKPMGNFKNIMNLQDISILIGNFLEEKENPVVLLDGLEFLISRNDFNTVFRFIQEKRFNVMEENAILIAPLDTKTLTEREKALITSELKIMSPMQSDIEDQQP